MADYRLKQGLHSPLPALQARHPVPPASQGPDPGHRRQDARHGAHRPSFHTQTGIIRQQRRNTHETWGESERTAILPTPRPRTTRLPLSDTPRFPARGALPGRAGITTPRRPQFCNPDETRAGVHDRGVTPLSSPSNHPQRATGLPCPARTPRHGAAAPRMSAHPPRPTGCTAGTRNTTSPSNRHTFAPRTARASPSAGCCSPFRWATYRCS